MSTKLVRISSPGWWVDTPGRGQQVELDREDVLERQPEDEDRDADAQQRDDRDGTGSTQPWHSRAANRPRGVPIPAAKIMAAHRELDRRRGEGELAAGPARLLMMLATPVASKMLPQ